MTEFKELEKLSLVSESFCSCNTCKKMCVDNPCIGTPKDIQKIIDAGFKKYLSSTIWAVSIRFGELPINIIAPLRLPTGCAFLNEDGLCKLHDLGLKPTEGRLATHVPIVVKSLDNFLPLQIAKKWETQEGIDLVKNF